MDNVIIRQYEGWSITNMSNHINFCHKGENTILLVSDKEINELETLGIVQIAKENANIWEGLDLDITIIKANYEKTKDRIRPCLHLCDYDKISIPYINKVSKFLLDIDSELLNKSKDIIYIYFNAKSRYNKSRFWKFKHKRQVNIHNYY